MTINSTTKLKRKQRKFRQALASKMARIEEIKEDVTSRLDKNFPEEYKTPVAVSYITKMFFDQKAKNLQEAITMYEEYAGEQELMAQIRAERRTKPTQQEAQLRDISFELSQANYLQEKALRLQKETLRQQKKAAEDAAREKSVHGDYQTKIRQRDYGF